MCDFFHEAEDTRPLIQVSLAIVFKHELQFYWHYIFPFILLKQQDHLSNPHWSLFIDKNLRERYESVLETQSIDWTFVFKKDTIDEAKVEMIKVLFDFISDSDLNFVCLAYIYRWKGRLLKQ